jgi:alpha-tubulin suppressor-like RCC1 family protein
VFTWGAGDGGQTGTGEGTGSDRPVLVGALRTHRRKALSCAAGRVHSVCVCTEPAGRAAAAGARERAHGAAATTCVMSFGRAAHGQLGLARGAGALVDALEPRAVRLPAEHGCVCAVSCGEAHTLALTADGTVLAWGDGANGRLGIPQPESAATRALAAGRPTADGGWSEWSPTAVRLSVAGALPVACVAAGWRHSLCATVDGQLFAWGANEAGQLGLGAGPSRTAPMRVESLARERCVLVAAGGAHSLCLTAAGALFAWGDGSCGQLGHGRARSQEVPRMVDPAPSAPVCLSAGACHSCVIDSAGQVWAAGADAYGQLGGAGEPLGAEHAAGGCAGGGQRARLAEFARVPLERTFGEQLARAADGGGGGGACARTWRAVQVACGAWHTVALVHVHA